MNTAASAAITLHQAVRPRTEPVRSRQRRGFRAPAGRLAAAFLVALATACERTPPASPTPGSDTPTTSATSPTSPAPAPATAGPELSFPESRAALGVVRSGTIIEHAYEVHNSSPRTLTLGTIASDCGCVSSSVATNILKPDERTTLNIRIAVGNRIGERTHHTEIEVFAADKPATGDPDGFFKFATTFDSRAVLEWPSADSVIDLGEIDAAALPTERRFTIRRGEFPAAFDTIIPSLEPSKPFALSIAQLTADEWAVTVRLPATRRLGALRASLTLTPVQTKPGAAGPAPSAESRRLFAAVTGSLTLSPTSLLIGVVEPGAVIEQTIEIETAPTPVLRFVEVLAPPGITIDPNNVPTIVSSRQTGREITLGLRAPIAPGPVECDLLFASDQPGVEIAVPILLHVAGDRANPATSPAPTNTSARTTTSASAKANPAATEPGPEPVAGPTLDRPLALWREGEAEEALRALAAAPWDDPAANFADPAFATSEAKFLNLPADQQASLKARAFAAVTDLRALFRAGAERHASLLASGKNDEARALAAGLRGLARRLAGPDRLDIIAALAKPMNERLDRMPDAKPDSKPPAKPDSK